MTLTVLAKIDPDEQAAQARAALQAGDFAQASDICANVLEQAPDHKDALYMLAVAHRYLKRYDRALLVIGRLLAVDASFWPWVSGTRPLFARCGRSARRNDRVSKRSVSQRCPHRELADAGDAAPRCRPL